MGIGRWFTYWSRDELEVALPSASLEILTIEEHGFCATHPGPLTELRQVRRALRPTGVPTPADRDQRRGTPEPLSVVLSERLGAIRAIAAVDTGDLSDRRSKMPQACNYRPVENERPPLATGAARKF